MKTLLLGSSTSNEVMPSHPVLSRIKKDLTPRVIEGKHLGIKHAAIQLPPVDQDASLSDYIEPIRTDFDSYIPEIKALLFGDTQQIKGTSIRNSAQKRDQDLNQKKAEIDSEIELLKSNMQEQPSYTPMYIMGIGILLILLIYSGEISFLASSLQIISTTYLSALILAIGVSTSMLLISHLGPAYINTFRSLKTRQVARIILCSIVVAGFWFLGSLRSRYVSLSTNDNSEAFSFVLVNSILFLGMFFIAAFLVIPNVEPVKRIRETIRANNKLKEMQTKSNSVGEEIDDNKVVLEKELSSILNDYHLAKAAERLIDNLYQKAVSEYILHNTLKRGHRVPCFSNSPRPLDFSTLLPSKKNEN